MNDQLLQETLNKALEMEEKGYKFYKETGQKSPNDVTRRTFDFLASGEVLHIESIKKFFKAMEEKNEFPSIALDDVRGKRVEDLNIFSKSISTLKEKVKSVADDKKAYEFAMEFENSGYKYYESMLKDAKDEKLAALLKFLLKEESKHHDLLLNTYTYLTDSQNWFMYEEGSFPQG
ncbi:MAG: ferritin family protein [Candidatus Omnitrophica bacterium]|nr:ferritin family protein [Candidatus Omnitrophota bacterium]